MKAWAFRWIHILFILLKDEKHFHCMHASRGPDRLYMARVDRLLPPFGYNTQIRSLPSDPVSTRQTLFILLILFCLFSFSLEKKNLKKIFFRLFYLKLISCRVLLKKLDRIFFHWICVSKCSDAPIMLYLCSHDFQHHISFLANSMVLWSWYHVPSDKIKQRLLYKTTFF